jgi:hypothetical protein
MGLIISVGSGRRARRSSRRLRLEAGTARTGLRIVRPAIGGARRSGPPSIGVRGADEKRAGEHCDAGEQCLERGDRVRPHSTSSRGIERVETKALDGGEAQGVDRRFGKDQSRAGRFVRGQAEEGFGPAGQRAFVGWSAHVDMGDGAMAVQMGEPGACGRSLAQHADG